MTESGRIKLLAGILLAVFLVFGGALISIPWLIRDPLPVLRPDTAMNFTLGEEPGLATGRIELGRGNHFVVQLGLDPDAGLAGAPRLILTHRDGPEVAPELEALSGNRYRAQGRLDVPGQWRIQIADRPDVGFRFVLAEF